MPLDAIAIAEKGEAMLSKSLLIIAGIGVLVRPAAGQQQPAPAVGQPARALQPAAKPGARQAAATSRPAAKASRGGGSSPRARAAARKADPRPLRPTLFGPINIEALRRSRRHAMQGEAIAGGGAGPLPGQASTILNSPPGVTQPGYRIAAGQNLPPGGIGRDEPGRYTMTSYRNAQGGLTTYVYDRRTAQTAAYNQATSVDGIYGGPLPGVTPFVPGPPLSVNVSPNTAFSGPVSNPSVDLIGPYATGIRSPTGPGGPSGAMPTLNSANPSLGGIPAGSFDVSLPAAAPTGSP